MAAEAVADREEAVDSPAPLVPLAEPMAEAEAAALFRRPAATVAVAAFASSGAQAAATHQRTRATCEGIYFRSPCP